MVKTSEVPSWPKLLILSAKSYSRTFIVTWHLFLLAALIKAVFHYLHGIPSISLRVIVAIVLALIEIYFLSTAMWLTHQTLKKNKVEIWEAAKNTFKKLPYIYFNLFCIFVVIMLFFIFTFFIEHLIAPWVTTVPYLAALAFIIFGIPALIISILCFFVWPLSVVQSFPPLETFVKSKNLVTVGFIPVFLTYATITFLNVVIYHNATYQWLIEQAYYIGFDILMSILIGPFLMNLILILMDKLENHAFDVAF